MKEWNGYFSILTLHETSQVERSWRRRVTVMVYSPEGHKPFLLAQAYYNWRPENNFFLNNYEVNLNDCKPQKKIHFRVRKYAFVKDDCHIWYILKCMYYHSFEHKNMSFITFSTFKRQEMFIHQYIMRYTDKAN